MGMRNAAYCRVLLAILMPLTVQIRADPSEFVGRRIHPQHFLSRMASPLRGSILKETIQVCLRLAAHKT